MLSEQELRNSPLFHSIRYEEYLRMVVCFQAVQKSFRTEELRQIYTEDQDGQRIDITNQVLALLESTRKDD